MRTAGIILALILVFPLSCRKQEKVVAPNEKITIGVASVILSLPIIIAQEKAYFSGEGLDVTFKGYPFGKPAMEAMFKGDVDVSTVAETPIVFNSFNRDDFAVFGTFAYSYDDSKVLGRKDRGISRPADLKGRRIGITAKTSSHFFAHIYLSEYNIAPSAVTMVDLPAMDLPAALQSGRIDAMVAFEPHAYRAMKLQPDNIARLPGSNLFRETFNLVIMKEYAKGHPHVPIRILRAVDRAISFIKQNREESVAIGVNYLKAEKAFLNAVLDDFVFKLSLDHALIVTLEDEARWAIKNRLTNISKSPNYMGYFYSEAMEALKPEALSTIK